MTSAETYELLAAQVEALRAPNRAVDGDIALAVGWAKSCWRRGTAGTWARGTFFEQIGNDLENTIECPRYTASLDAAVQLVPTQCQWVLGLRQPPNGGAWADVGPSSAASSRGNAATPALALTAAALRARAVEVAVHDSDKVY